VRPHRRRIRARVIADAIVATVIAVVALGPILFGLSTSLKARDALFRFPPELWPASPTWDNYRLLFSEGVAVPILNSVLITAATVVLSLAIGSLTAYALARFAFRLKGAVLVLVVVVMSIPLPSLIVPTFTFASQVGLIDSRIGLVLFYTAYQLPLAAWILWGFFTTVPEQLEQAAMIDGYSRLAALRRVVLPLSTPGLVAAGLFVLIFAWNDFVVALVLINSESLRTLPVAIYYFQGFFGREWGPLTASAMLSIVPVLIVFVIFQRHFLSGMTAGSVKG
jgi:ABC-type glycerol-3-phosphate transport system permease component